MSGSGAEVCGVPGVGGWGVALITLFTLFIFLHDIQQSKTRSTVLQKISSIVMSYDRRLGALEALCQTGPSDFDIRILLV